ncbi:MAG: hypothetical protein P8046_15135, partial [Anaerolineales bacterium]
MTNRGVHLPPAHAAFKAYSQERTRHWDAVARRLYTWQSWGRFYARRLEQVYRFLASPGQRILEIGCGQGDLLASLNAKTAVGVDFSSEMITRA